MKYPITPPPELLKQWEEVWFNGRYSRLNFDELIPEAFQAGADQELEACCAELESIPSPLGIPFGKMAGNALRAARRPKPPSLKEQALAGLMKLEVDEPGYEGTYETIRRALEQLDD